MKLTLYIYVPESLKDTNMSIVINIEYDLAEAEINYNEYCAVNLTKLDRNEKNARMTYSVADYVYRITYNRRLQEITHRKTKRNIGMNVTILMTTNIWVTTKCSPDLLTSSMRKDHSLARIC